ncbi:MAG: DUF1801 domain-containing protein [Flavobacteriaceae bacterium]|nr:DUF1801 domain-containing protein [Flavobacteriaceae bacterium]MDG1962711.1 DUF1801 domain-containing protein [Flavobacteriaceae bacterium]
MSDVGTTVEGYIKQVPEDRRAAFEQLRQAILNHLPKGFVETISYGMIGYVVPHTTYPAGYHCSPKLPLPFINLANQKNFIALYHMGIYADPELLDWYVTAYPSHSKTKLDMGKSCLRFKKMDQIPFDLIGQLCQKMSPQDWIARYEANYKR